jgi:hypothetical protein
MEILVECKDSESLGVAIEGLNILNIRGVTVSECAL